MGGGDSSRQASGWVRQPEGGAQAWGGGWGQGRREGLAQGGVASWSFKVSLQEPHLHLWLNSSSFFHFK